MTTRFRIHDPWLFLLGLAATIVGLFCVFDAGYARSLQADKGAFSREFLGQLFPFAVGIGACFLISRFDPDKLRKRAPLIILCTLILLTLPMVPGLGVEMGGATRWVKIWKLPAFQPAEFAKILIVVYLAAVLTNRKPWIKPKTKDRVDWLDKVFVKKLGRLFPALLVLFAILLIELEPDLGTAAVIAATAYAMFIVGGASRKSLIVGLACAVVAAGVMVKMQPYRMERFAHHFTRWTDKNVDETGYQTVQAEMAMASGGVVGVGPGNGRAKHVMPAATTDFITATIGEEFGIVGATGVLALLGLMVLRMLKLASKAQDRFRALILYGTASWIGIQTVVNVLMASGLWPAIGIPMPFISSGGSSLVALWFAIGFCQSAVAVKVEKEDKLASSSDGRWDGRTRLPSSGSRTIRA